MQLEIRGVGSFACNEKEEPKKKGTFGKVATLIRKGGRTSTPLELVLVPIQTKPNRKEQSARESGVPREPKGEAQGRRGTYPFNLVGLSGSFPPSDPPPPTAEFHCRPSF